MGIAKNMFRFTTTSGRYGDRPYIALSFCLVGRVTVPACKL
ncbi:hypothetical protein D3OALGA1CA_1110, partial [Olavius algarvensis associated proteobacterium Delta 3]